MDTVELQLATLSIVGMCVGAFGLWHGMNSYPPTNDEVACFKNQNFMNQCLNSLVGILPPESKI